LSNDSSTCVPWRISSLSGPIVCILYLYRYHLIITYNFSIICFRLFRLLMQFDLLIVFEQPLFLNQTSYSETICLRMFFLPSVCS
jgi:hypothetical protein